MKNSAWDGDLAVLGYLLEKAARDGRASSLATDPELSAATRFVREHSVREDDLILRYDGVFVSVVSMMH